MQSQEHGPRRARVIGKGIQRGKEKETGRGKAGQRRATIGRHTLRQTTQTWRLPTSASDRPTTTRSGETLTLHHRSERSNTRLADLSLPSHVTLTERRRESIGRLLTRAESNGTDGIHAVVRSTLHMSTTGDRQDRRARQTSKSVRLSAGRQVNWKAATTARVQMEMSPPCQCTPGNIRQSSGETA